MRKGLLVLMALMLVVSWSFATEHPGITPIKTVQYVADPATDDASPMLGDTVTVEGWVTWEPQSKGGDSFFMADSAGAWHGINVYSSDGDDWNFAFGTHIRVRGEVGAYQGLTEIMPMDPVADITVLADTVDWANPPAAIAYTVIDPADFAGGAATIEQYESVLVQFNDVYCSNEDAGFGEWEVSDGTNDVLIDNPQTDIYGYQHKWMLNMPYDYVRGVINSHYGYKLLPEIAHDLKVAEDPSSGWYTQFAYFQQVRPSDMVIRAGAAADYTTDYSYESADYWEFFVPDTNFVEDTLTVKGVVTMETGLSYAGDGVKFIMSDAVYYGDEPYEEQPWSSVLSYDPDSTAFPTLYSGFMVQVTGYISEYLTDEGHMTELFITKPITIVGAADSLPAPVEVTVEEVRDPMTIEPWGTAFVYLKDLLVTNNAPTLSNMKFVVDDIVPDAIPGFGIDDDSDFESSPEVDNWDTFGQPPVNTVIDSVVGWVYHHFGGYEGTDGTTWAYKVAPRYPLTEIVIGLAPPNVLSLSRDVTVGDPTTPVNVESEISDFDGTVDSAKVVYKVGLDGSWNFVDMSNTTGDMYTGAIPAQAEGEFVFYFVQAWDDLGDDTVYPDTSTQDPHGYKCTDGDLTYYDIQVNPLGGGASLYEGYEVTLTGVLLDSFVVGDAYGTYDLAAPIYWMQGGDSAAYNAIAVDIPTDLMPTGEYFNTGDEVTVTGTVWENDPGLSGTNAWQWGDLTRISDVTAATLESSNNEPVVYTLTADELVGNAEKYESQLVKVMDPTMTVANSYDWTFNDGNGDFLVDDDVIVYTDDITVQDWFDNLEVGVNPDYLQGIWLYSYSTWKLELRGYYDVAGLTPEEGVAEGQLPLTYALSPIYPNPFNPSATVAFQLPENARVKVLVYNMLGQQVRTLVDKPMVAGQHRVTFDGGSLASGVYFVRMDANNFTQMRRMVLVK